MFGDVARRRKLSVVSRGATRCADQASLKLQPYYKWGRLATCGGLAVRLGRGVALRRGPVRRSGAFDTSEGRVPLGRRMPSQCHLLCQVGPSASLGGADALVRSRPPGRLLFSARAFILREKSGTKASRADQGVRPTINAESHHSGNVSDIGMASCAIQRVTPGNPASFRR